MYIPYLVRRPKEYIELRYQPLKLVLEWETRNKKTGSSVTLHQDDQKVDTIART